MLAHEDVVAFLESELGLDTAGLDGGSLLFSSGFIDSFSLVSLMLFLEREGGFRIGPSEVNLDNLDSIDRIIAFVQRRSA